MITKQLIQDAQKRVKAGVALLDKKIPNWRTTIRKHRRQFDFQDSEHCVIGTLEHYSGRLRQLKTKFKFDGNEFAFDRGLKLLKASAALHGFDVEGGVNRVTKYGYSSPGSDTLVTASDEYEVLDALWRAEIGI